MAFTIALLQIAPDKGKIEQNLDRIADAIKQTASEGGDLLLGGESCVSGYILEGGVEELAMSGLELTQALSNRLGKANHPVDFSLGFYEKAAGKPFNSMGYWEWNESGVHLKTIYRKYFLPTYHVFDEARFMQAGDELGILDTRFGRIGLLICEDVWHSILTTMLATAGCDLILVSSASPARNFQEDKPLNIKRYEKMLSSVAEEHCVYLAMSMLVGFEGGKGLVGGSMLVEPSGRIAAQAHTFDEQLLLAPIDLNEIQLARQRTPLFSDLRFRWSDLIKLGSKIDPLP